MAKATAKVPTTGKEDLSGWEKKVDIAAPHHQTFHLLTFRATRRAVSRSSVGSRHKASVVSERHTRPPAYETPRRTGPPALHRRRTHRHPRRARPVDAGARLRLRAGERGFDEEVV